MPPIRPMLAKAMAKMPRDSDLAFEPKWDGFRCIVFRDGDEVVLGSRNEKPLTRYFPEMPEPLRGALPDKAVVDGELVLTTPDGLSFDLLGQRIHPADSRVQMLAEHTPATFVAFDMLAFGDRSLLDSPFSERQRILDSTVGSNARVRHTPRTMDPDQAEEWFHRFEGAGFDGVIAKPLDGLYQPNIRALFKVKHQRELDAVVAGYRLHKDNQGVGSLLLGLYGDDGRLHHIGVASSFTATERAALVDRLAPYVLDDPTGHPWADWAQAEAHDGGVRMPGTPHRWTGQRDHSWIPLRPDLVVEVNFNQLTHGRLRHPAKVRRWRDDKSAQDCGYDQLVVEAPPELSEIFDLPSALRAPAAT